MTRLPSVKARGLVDRSVSQTFTATVVPAGNATGVEVPAEVVGALGAGKRPKVVITINRHSWRSRVASMGGRFVVGISAANRAASGIVLGDEVEIALELDTEPRVVAEPVDLAGALDADRSPVRRSTVCRTVFAASTWLSSRMARTRRPGSGASSG